MGKQIKHVVEEYTKVLDIDFINEIIEHNGKLDDFEMNKSTIMNIGEWALNGESDDEIRKHLNLTPTQWGILVSICPTLLLVMRDSRALADAIIAGSLFQTAIGGKRIKREIARTVGIYDQETGKKIGEKLEKIELEEELPPNADLLKFLATHKLSEKFGDGKYNNSSNYGDVVKSLSPEQMALIDAMRNKGNGEETE